MPLLTKKKLAIELDMPLTGVQALCREKKIPVIRLSRKTIRFDLAEVKAALAKFTVKAVG